MYIRRATIRRPLGLTGSSPRRRFNKFMKDLTGTDNSSETTQNSPGISRTEYFIPSALNRLNDFQLSLNAS